MRHVAAYLLCVLGGNASPAASDVEKVLSSIGADVDNEKLELLIKELDGKDINEVIEAGKKKISNVSIGGGAAAASTNQASPAAETPAAKVEEKEEEEEADLAGGMDMFGGGSDY